MTPLENRLMHLANLLVGGTGLVYGVLKFFFMREGEYGPEMHVAQPAWQHAHVLAAPLLVILLGMFWKSHIQPYWQRGLKEGRRTGLGMVALAVPMIASGYLLQVAESGAWRSIWMWVHIGVSLLWILFYLGHWLLHWWARRQRV
ncbi:MAG: hypothetical protein ACI9TH_000119 [Kiritimatiellia bacterium]|jgi:hypothetical protein